jgi:FHA domain
VRKYLAIVLVVIVLAGSLPARAQTTESASLFALDISAYPTLSAALDVFDASGNFITGLTTDQVILLEDNETITLSTLQEFHPGVEFVVALDPGPYFGYRDINAVTRLDKVKAVLQNWATAHSDSLGDDLSLTLTGGVDSTHISSAAFSDSLSAYQPDLQALTPSLDTLSRALDAVSEPALQVGMKRVVLYICTVPTVDSISVLQDLTQRAVDLNVRVHVWIVTPQDLFSSSGATALKDLAIRTGGQYSFFTGSEALPDPELYLARVRHVYTLAYSSAIRTAGTHLLSVQVILGDGTLTSNTLSFDLNVQPPNPILVTPPEQIVRQGAEPRSTDFAAFQPTMQEINAIIEFPDGHQRPLVRTALYVDGALADENTSEPFDRFNWDLSDYTLSSAHTLQVEAADSLGLSNVSLGVKVTVTVVQPERGFLPFLVRNSLWVALGAVGLAGVAMTVTLIIGRKRGRKSSAEAGQPSGRKTGSRFAPDPLRQAVESTAAKPARSRPRPRSASVKQSDAYLLRLKEDGQPITAPPIPVATPEMTFGSDPIQATRVLDDPSVSPLHARLKDENGRFVLADEKSAAGTWVNYELLSGSCALQHGDILHIGRISYRFMLRRPPEVPAPRVLPVKK